MPEGHRAAGPWRPCFVRPASHPRGPGCFWPSRGNHERSPASGRYPHGARNGRQGFSDGRAAFELHAADRAGNSITIVFAETVADPSTVMGGFNLEDVLDAINLSGTVLRAELVPETEETRPGDPASRQPTGLSGLSVSGAQGDAANFTTEAVRTASVTSQMVGDPVDDLLFGGLETSTEAEVRRSLRT